MSTEQRMANHIEFIGDCWVWTGSIDRYGYGRMKYQNRNMQAHRVAYTLFIADIPAGMVLDHTCRNRRCCNPAHLEPVTLAENTRRGFAARGY